jgi:hypothetical protein
MSPRVQRFIPTSGDVLDIERRNGSTVRLHCEDREGDCSCCTLTLDEVRELVQLLTDAVRTP